MIDEDSQACNRCDEKLNSECVMVAVVGGLELGVHEVHSDIRRNHKDDLHDRVVQGHKSCEQVQVSCGVHHCEHYLRLARQA